MQKLEGTGTGPADEAANDADPAVDKGTGTGPADEAAKDADAAGTDTGTADEAGTGADAGGFKPITSQEALDAILQARLGREKAKYADYDTIKADVAKLTADLEAERAAREASEAEVANLRGEKSLETARMEAATAAGIDPAFLADTPLERLAERASELAAKLPKGAVGPYVPTEGTTATAAAPVKPGVGTLAAAYAEAATN